MTGFDQFLSLFGNITVLNVIEFAFAIAFIVIIYRKIRKWQIEKYEQDKKHQAELKEALDGVHKYPEYRQQSIEIQKLLTRGIEDNAKKIEQITKMCTAFEERLNRMESDTKRRERNKTRDRLIQLYQHYTNPEINPSQSWSQMESDAFWELFSDYEADGGDGYIHTTVEPAMRALKII